MIDIPAALQAKLDAGVTTLAWCWVVARRDGAVFGFTDHDAPLEVVGVACEPASGFSPGETRSEASFSPARGAVFGALNSERIAAADLDKGVWDGAEVRVYRVDWSEPSLFYRAFTGALGAVKRTRSGFEAETAGPTARLERVIGRVFAKTCDADLGDARCRIDLSDGEHRGEGAVVAVPAPAAIIASGLQRFGRDRLRHGRLVWTSGANAGAAARIRVHRRMGQQVLLEFERAPAEPPRPGDGFAATVGCDKTADTCRTRFANLANFRGCPHMPGNDALMRSAASNRYRLNR